VADDTLARWLNSCGVPKQAPTIVTLAAPVDMVLDGSTDDTVTGLSMVKTLLREDFVARLVTARDNPEPQSLDFRSMRAVSDTQVVA